MKKYLGQLFIAFFFLVACSPKSDKASTETTEVKNKVVNVYTQRHYDADKIVFDNFTNQTGIKVNVIKAGADELINKLALEGENSPADIFMTVDAAKLFRAKDRQLLQSVTLASASKIKEDLGDEENFWHPITYRARVIAYDKAKVSENDLSTYEDLSNAKWKNKILVRSSSSGYNQSLLASIIEAQGEEVAKTWAQGVTYNMARNPQGGDRDQVKAIASGVGELAIVNTYYVGQLLNSSNPEEKKAGEAVALFFPNQGDRGTHINVSGAGVTKYAPNREEAIKLLEFLQSDEAQTIFVNESFEFPANKNITLNETLKSWGDFKIDALTFSRKIENHEKGVKIFDEVGWK